MATFHVEITDRDDDDMMIRRIAVALTVLALLYAYGLLWWALAAAVAGWGVHRAWLQHLEVEEARRAILARADEQHRQVLSGDPRGTFGADYEADDE